jgi:hypothetical protein
VSFAARWRWGELLGLVALGIALLVMSRLPYLEWLAWPFRLFGTFVHELSHGLAAFATGGKFDRFVVNPDLSGLAWSAGGTRWIVASAGYIGSAIFGALLILAGRAFPARAVLGVLGLALALLCVFYVRNAFGAVAGLALAAGMMLGAVYLRGLWSEALLLVLALQLLLDGFRTVIDLVFLSARGDVHTDAATLAQLTGLPAPAWAVIWGLFSAAVALGTLALAYRSGHPAAPGHGDDAARQAERSGARE